MRRPGWMRTEGFATLCVFVGAAALVTWLGGAVWALMHGEPTRSFGCLIMTTVFVPPAPILAILGLRWGLRTLGERPSRRKCLLQALIPVAVIAPALGFAGMMLPFASMVWFSNTFLRDRTPKMVTASPDGRRVAYFERTMTAGGWGQVYYVKDDKGRSRPVGGTGDYNYLNRIQWSPDNGIVIFQKGSDLEAVRIRDYKIRSVPLAYGKADATGAVQMRPLEKIDFPEPGVFVILYSDGTASRTVRMGD